MNLSDKDDSKFRFLKDFLSLIVNRGLDSLIGVVIIPYLIYRIGSVEYGKIVLAQSIIYLGVAFVNYGLDLIILKRVPQYVFYRKIKSISIIISRIMLLKFILFLICILVYSILAVIFPFSDQINMYVIILSFLCLSEVISTSHLLVVFKNVKILPFLSALRFIFIFIFTFFFIKSSEDAVYYVYFYSFSYALSNVIVFFYTTYKYKLRYYLRVKSKSLISILKSSSPFFISRINLLLADKLYNILAALFISLSAAALLDISFKILSVIVIPVQILSNVILSRFTMRSSSSFVKRILAGITFFSLLLFILLMFFRSYILNYYSMPVSFDILFSLGVILSSSIFANLSVYIGNNVMVVFSLERYLVKSSIYSSLIIFSALLFTLIYVSKSLVVFSIFFLIHKFLEFSFRVVYSWKSITGS